MLYGLRKGKSCSAGRFFRKFFCLVNHSHCVSVLYHETGFIPYRKGGIQMDTFEALLEAHLPMLRRLTAFRLPPAEWVWLKPYARGVEPSPLTGWKSSPFGWLDRTCVRAALLWLGRGAIPGTFTGGFCPLTTKKYPYHKVWIFFMEIRGVEPLTS